MTTILLLTLSNVFMTFAWYGHLKYRHAPLFKVCHQLAHRRCGVLFSGASQPHRLLRLRLAHPALSLRASVAAADPALQAALKYNSFAL
jgi:hypothetical protein